MSKLFSKMPNLACVAGAAVSLLAANLPARATTNSESTKSPPAAEEIRKATIPAATYQIKKNDTTFTAAKELNLVTEYATFRAYLLAEKLLSKDQLKPDQIISKEAYQKWKGEQLKYFIATEHFRLEPGDLFKYEIQPGDSLGGILTLINANLSLREVMSEQELITGNNQFNDRKHRISKPQSITAGNSIVFSPCRHTLASFTGHPFLTGLSPETIKEVKSIFSRGIANNLSLGLVIHNSGDANLSVKHRAAIIEILSIISHQEQLRIESKHHDLLELLRPDVGLGKLLASSQSAETKELIIAMLKRGPKHNLNIEPIAAVRMLAKDLACWTSVIHQGNKGTCAPTALTLEVAEHNPLALVRITSSLYVHGEFTFAPTHLPVSYITNKLEFNPSTNHNDSSGRDWLQKMWQISLMESANGVQRYDNPEDCHWSADSKTKEGYGASFYPIADLLTLMMDEKYVRANAPTSEEGVMKLSEVAKKHPVLLSLQWSKLTDKEKQELAKEKGGSPEDYVTNQGMALHAVAFHSYDPISKMVLIINPHNHRRADQDLKTALSKPEKGIVRYAYGEYLEAIYLDEFLSKGSAIILPAKHEQAVCGVSSFNLFEVQKYPFLQSASLPPATVGTNLSNFLNDQQPIICYFYILALGMMAQKQQADRTL